MDCFFPRIRVSRVRVSRTRFSRAGITILVGFCGGRMFLTVLGVPSLFISNVFLKLSCFAQNGIPLFIKDWESLKLLSIFKCFLIIE